MINKSWEVFLQENISTLDACGLVACSCGRFIPTQAELRRHWQSGHFGELEAKTFVLKKKCIVKDCRNHTDEGEFVGDLCFPCHEFIVNNKGAHSQAYRNSVRSVDVERIEWLEQNTRHLLDTYYHIAYNGPSTVRVAIDKAMQLEKEGKAVI